MTDEVLLERKGAVAHLTLNRPDAGNAIDVPMARALLEAAVACDVDPGVRCVIVRGNGRMFCVGGDIGRLLSLIHISLASVLRAFSTVGYRR